MTDLLTGNKRAALSFRKDDLYETPEVAIEALLRTVPLPHFIWEPACGPGSIVRSLRSSGRNVIATDLVDYRCPNSQSGIDFLMERKAPPLIQAIITNPPFKLAGEFVERGLELCPRVIMLLRLAFLESKRRTAILDGGSLASVLVFKNRLPMMHRGGWNGNKSGSAMAFAWFLWDREHKGPATISRIAWGENHAAEGEPAGMTKSIDVLEYHTVNGTPCAYCQRTMDARSPRLMPTRDHTTPKCMGGRHLVWCCYDCNRIKSDMTFDSWQEFMADYPGWWHGVPARIRNCYRPGWLPYEKGDNAVNNDR